MRETCTKVLDLIEQYTRPDFYMWLLHDYAGQKSDPYKRATEAKALLAELLNSTPSNRAPSPVVAQDARALVEQFVYDTAPLRLYAVEVLVERITTLANQRYVEGLKAAVKIANQWAGSHSCDAHDDNPCCHVRTGATIAGTICALLNEEKMDG